ncbi:MAG: hypothetical protein R3E48_19970 [Burkholderiaceae bacterium]
MSIWNTTLQATVSSTNMTPSGCSAEPGRTMISMPRKPIAAPTHRRQPTNSPSRGPASSMITSGAMKLIAVASACGR